MDMLRSGTGVPQPLAWRNWRKQIKPDSRRPGNLTIRSYSF